jgi:predicted nucleotidyltransferase
MPSLAERTLLLAIAGSRAQGLHGPDSDVDLRGVASPTEAELLGYRGAFAQADQPGDMDPFRSRLSPEEAAAARHHKVEGCVYALAKFARLAADCNPNILEALFCREAELRVLTPLGRRLRDRRTDFLSERARHAFSGYAKQQLKRIQGHRHWLLSPPAGPPDRGDFGLPERTLVPAEHLAAAEAAVRKKLDAWSPDWGPLPHSEIVRLEGALAETLTEVLTGGDDLWRRAARTIGLSDNLIEAMDRERRYRSAQRAWEQYRTWQRQRNPARAALEAEHGYDTKHAAHLVRLLRMGREIVETGAVHVWRGDRDADELRAVRAGAWTYDRLLAEADVELARLAAVRAPAVPPQPDHAALDALVVDLHRRALSGER